MGHVVLSMGILLGCLILGVGLCRIPRVRDSPVARHLTGAALFVLLFFMGFRLERAIDGSGRLAEIGLLSLAFGVATLIGTAVVLTATFALVRREEVGIPESGARDAGPVGGSGTAVMEFLRHLKVPTGLLACAAAGYGAAWLLLREDLTGETACTWTLRVLLVAVGMDLGRSGIDFRCAFARRELLLIPVGTAVGSLAGGAMVALFCPVTWNQSLAVAAGFGWYSLSGAILTDLGDPLLGSTAFVSNIVREAIALLTIPLIGNGRFRGVAVGLGGATSMDVTLPVIERSCGVDMVPAAIASGALLSLLVPMLVPLFYQLHLP